MRDERECLKDFQNREYILVPGRYSKDDEERECAHEIGLIYNYNGSGADAFGGAKSWPVIELHSSFETYQEKRAKKFADDLGKFVKGWIKENVR